MDSESRDSEGFSRPVTPAHMSPKRPKLEPKEDRSSPTEVVSFFFFVIILLTGITLREKSKIGLMYIILHLATLS